MYFNDHHEFEGKHAFLGASQYHWMDWTDKILKQRWINSFSTDIGTYIHELASILIKRKLKLNVDDTNIIELTLLKNGIPANVYSARRILNNLINFVNDAIDDGMQSEVILFYSDLAFGTTDAIKFDDIHKKLIIRDLKTGKTPAKFNQLLIYAALFCLEYDKNPYDFTTELAIYQAEEIISYEPSADEIIKYMDKIRDTELMLRDIREGVDNIDIESMFK